MPRLTFASALVCVLSLVLISLTACSADSLQQRKTKIQVMGASQARDALDRKQRSEAVMRSEGVRLNPHLPVIESESDAKPRTRDEVAYRAMALLVVSAKGAGQSKSTIDKLVADYQLDKHLTPKERAFVRNSSPSQHDNIQFSWRYEAAWTLLWALGYVDELAKPTATCDVEKALAFMMKRSEKQFLADAKLRPVTEILDKADLIYRYRWAIVDARINGRSTPASLEPGVAVERHHALNWLIGYMDQAWDDVSKDT